MTPMENLSAERDRVISERGCYITPYRMVNVMKSASSVFRSMVFDASVNYEECRIILDIVGGAIDRICGEEGKAAPKKRTKSDDEVLAQYRALNQQNRQAVDNMIIALTRIQKENAPSSAATPNGGKNKGE